MASERLESFDLNPGRLLAGKYVVERRLGAGWEGEVYKIRELKTDIERAAKFYFPHRDPRGRATVRYARKLNKLKDCSILVQYHHQDHIQHRRRRVDFLVSEYVDGQLLSEFVAQQRGARLTSFEALRLLYDLACGVAQIHRLGDYHGDIHTQNVIVRRAGIRFVVKLIDFFDFGASNRSKIADDVIDLIHVFYESLGGARHYARQPAVVKDICKGLKRTLILKRFRTAADLRAHLEAFSWDNA